MITLTGDGAVYQYLHDVLLCRLLSYLKGRCHQDVILVGILLCLGVE